MNPSNIADRITAGMAVDPPLSLLSVAVYATRDGIKNADSAQLREWARDIYAAADELQGQGGQYWASVARELESMAHEKSTGAGV
jgi:hypothetical protein